MYSLITEEKQMNEQMLETFLNRRSIRTYTGEPVPMEKLNIIIMAGLSSASSRAVRPWDLIVVRDKDKLIDMSGCRWIQGRGREAIDGGSTEDYLRRILQFPSECRLEAILSLGMPDEELPARTMESLPFNKVHINKY